MSVGYEKIPITQGISNVNDPLALATDCLILTCVWRPLPHTGLRSRHDLADRSLSVSSAPNRNPMRLHIFLVGGVNL